MKTNGWIPFLQNLDDLAAQPRTPIALMTDDRHEAHGAASTACRGIATLPAHRKVGRLRQANPITTHANGELPFERT